MKTVEKCSFRLLGSPKRISYPKYCSQVSCGGGGGGGGACAASGRFLNRMSKTSTTTTITATPTLIGSHGNFKEEPDAAVGVGDVVVWGALE